VCILYEVQGELGGVLGCFIPTELNFQFEWQDGKLVQAL
jgi:hypothetical protein